jgi:hypothetical protein
MMVEMSWEEYMTSAGLRVKLSMHRQATAN